MQAAREQPSAESLTELEAALAERCEDSLHLFIREAWQHVDPVPYIDGPHIGLLSEYLEAFIAGEIPRLLINIPPGHMKSISVSVMLNAWTWTKLSRVGRRFMATSYRADLALRDADRTRQLIRSEWYQRRWGNVVGALRNTRLQIRRDQDQKSRFSNIAGGYRFSSAIAGIMGEGGDYIILDDPHNVEQAESDDQRDKTVRLIRMALPTRVRSTNGGVCVMMQRLHSKDYAGEMLADKTDLVHVCLPARYERDHPFVMVPTVLKKTGREMPGDFRTTNGELLWPQLFDDERLSTLENELGTYARSGQFQQRPTPRTGGLFDRSRWKIIEELPKERASIVVRAWDLASTTEEENNKAAFTAGVRMWKIGHSYYIDKVRRFRGSPADVEKELKAIAKKDGKAVVIDLPQDPGQAGKFQVRYLVGILAGYSVFHSPEVGSKPQRADAYAAQQEVGNVYLIEDKTDPWTAAFIENHALFPKGDYNDEVDAASRAFARCCAGVVRVGRTTGAH